VSIYEKRARLAALKRHRPADDPVIAAAVTDLRTERLAVAIRDAVEAAPPLSDEQRVRLAAILRGQGAAHA
jgi:hypothetical protein